MCGVGSRTARRGHHERFRRQLALVMDRKLYVKDNCHGGRDSLCTILQRMTLSFPSASLILKAELSPPSAMSLRGEHGHFR